MDFESHLSDVAERGRQNFYESFEDPRFGVEAENLHLYDDFSAAENREFGETLRNTATNGEGELVFSPGQDGAPKMAILPSLEEAPADPAVTYDYGPQVELETQPVSNLTELTSQMEMLESLAQQSTPAGTQIHRLALLPGLQFPQLEFDDPFDWGREWGDEADDYRNPALRYENIQAAYGRSSIVMGGAGGFQFSAVPSADPDFPDVDSTVVDFIGAGGAPGIPALNPVFYGLNEASARIEDGGIATRHAREDTYVERHCRSDLIPSAVGDAKFGYIDQVLDGKLEDVESLEDIARFNSEKLLEYTARAPLEAFDPGDGGPGFQERRDYDHYRDGARFSLVLVGEDISPVSHRELVEREEVSGYLRLRTEEEGETRCEPASLDVASLADTREFLWRNYLQAESMNKPNIRPRFGYGCFENRDVDNNPDWVPTVGVQAAKMRNWTLFQEAAAEEGFQNADAVYLRQQQREHGLDAYLHPDTDTTIREFVGSNRHLFENAIYEPEVRDATLEYIDSVTSGGETFSDKAGNVGSVEELEQLVRYE